MGRVKKKEDNPNGARPPRLASALLRLLLGGATDNGAPGDLEERFLYLARRRGLRRARLDYRMQAAAAVTGHLCNTVYWSMVMLRSYLLVTLRNIGKHRTFSLINIAGLSVGMTCCIFIMAFIMHELSYDRFHENAGRICRLAARAELAGRTIEVATVPEPMGPQLVEDYPEVKSSVRIKKLGSLDLEYNGRRYAERGVIYVDNSFFEVFSFDLVRGDPKSVLTAPYSMVLTRTTARKYFGDEDPVGKTMRSSGDGEEFTVTGVVEDPPSNSHFSFDMLASFETLLRGGQVSMGWHNFDFHTYLLLGEQADAGPFEGKLADFTDKYLGDFLEAIGMKAAFFLQPLASIHLHSNIENEIEANGDIRYVYIFAGIGIFILLLACINFMNLSTARSANRAKEVGLRKVLGAERAMLRVQFLGESLLMAVISAVVALVLVSALVPRFNHLAAQEIDPGFLADPRMLSGLIGLVLFVGVAAGSYPAIFLSRFSPARILKGRSKQGAGSSGFRKALVVFQFTISIALIIGTGVISRQLDYMRSTDLGFEKEQVFVIPLLGGEVVGMSDVLKEELSSIEGVLSASVSMMVPGEGNFNTTAYYTEGSTPDEAVLLENFTVDENYIETFGIRLIAGRNFSREYGTDLENAILINETTARELGWEDPIGKVLFVGVDGEDVDTYTVVGMIGDIHHRSLHHPVEPLVLRYSYLFAGRLALRMETDDVPAAVAAIERKWKAITSGKPFDYFFLDDYCDGLYRSEERLAGIFRVFTLLAVFIGCLGLFGLASFAAEQRTREIGIRKVLGSTAGSIVMLLCGEFVMLVLLANIFAWPAAYVAMKLWLGNFPYQSDISIFSFLLAGVSAVVIALLTVGFRALKAARANPVESLRYE